MPPLEQTPERIKEDAVKNVKKLILEYYLQIDSEGNFTHQPGQSVAHLSKNDPERIHTEDQEFNEFVFHAFGIKFSNKVMTKGHSAPLKFFSDLYYERVKNALGFANRTGGKTLGVAVLNFMDMLFKKNCEVASAGAVLDQASKCYRYFRGFIESEWFSEFCERYEKTTGTKFIIKSIQSWTSFANGSLAEIITGSEKGMRSPHPHKARIDEIDLMEWSVLQTGLSMAHSSHGIRGQNVFTSTRQRATGPMQQLLDSAEEKGIKVYQWNVWEIIEKCDRKCQDDKVHGTCPIYAYCQGRAHYCEGFYKIDDFIDKVRLIDKESFETEWENKRPSRNKMVYWMFDNHRHVMTPEKLVEMTGFAFPSAHWTRVAGIDFGFAPGHPFCYLKLCQLPGGPWLLFHEYVAEQRLLKDHAAAIRSSPYFSPGELIFSDWDAQDREELRHYGINTKEAKKDVGPGIDYVSTLFSGLPPEFKPLLYIWHDCTFTLSEMGGYVWPIDPNGKVNKSGNPVKDHDNTPDALRYALFSGRSSNKSKYRYSKVSGL